MAAPTVIAHADWGVALAKRQVAAARLTAGSYAVTSLEPAPDGDPLRWLAATAPGQAMAGFDFVLGLPREYASAAEIRSFPVFLDAFGSPPWHEFAAVARQADEIRLQRPFYPAGGRGARREHLYKGLGLTAAQLRRRCEGTDAETLFWTLGGKQVGKGALAGWRLLSEARRRPLPVALWPFDGPLPALLDAQAGVVVAETYPREYYRHVRPPGPAWPRWSKRRRSDRLAWVPGILGWAQRLGVTWSESVRHRVEDGLSGGPAGEDEFDAVIGLLGMIAVVTGAIPAGEPGDDPAVTATEGWILGRQAAG